MTISGETLESRPSVLRPTGVTSQTLPIADYHRELSSDATLNRLSESDACRSAILRRSRYDFADAAVQANHGYVRVTTSEA